MVTRSWLPAPFVYLGLAAAAVGVVDGVVIAFSGGDRAPCPGDTGCEPHHYVAEGIAIIALSVMLAMLILLVASLPGFREQVDDDTGG